MQAETGTSQNTLCHLHIKDESKLSRSRHVSRNGESFHFHFFKLLTDKQSRYERRRGWNKTRLSLLQLSEKDNNERSTLDKPRRNSEHGWNERKMIFPLAVKENKVSYFEYLHFSQCHSAACIKTPKAPPSKESLTACRGDGQTLAFQGSSKCDLKLRSGKNSSKWQQEWDWNWKGDTTTETLGKKTLY